VANRINCELENWGIYRKQKVSGKWSSVLIGWSDEVNTHGLNHRANRTQTRSHRPWKGPYCVQGRTGHWFSGTQFILLATCLLAGSCWNYFFDPEDGGDMFLRNVGSTQQTTQRHTPEDDTLHNHSCENLKSYNKYTCSEPISELKAVVRYSIGS
jgi:hypothetical protein